VNVYKVTLTKKQNEQLLDCGDEGLETMAFFSKESNDYTNGQVATELLQILDIVDGAVTVCKVG